MMDVTRAVEELFLKNRRFAGEYQYTVPSPTSYPYQWLWDSCFHAIILSHFAIDDAKKELLSLISRQFKNGMIPHMIYWDKPTVINLDWGRSGTSTITQPPMIAYAVWQIYEKERDKNFLKLIYPALAGFYNYLLKERDPRNRHLIGIINPDESGEDNSPRFDIPLGLPPRHTIEENSKRRFALIDKNKECNFDAPFCMKNFFWVKDVPFNAIMIENLSKMEKIANELGHEEDVINFKEQRNFITQAMRDLMLEDGIFWSTYAADYRKIKVTTWAIFSPLFAGILNSDEAHIYINEYLKDSKKFWLKYPIPTVSKTDPAFDPVGFWRGPVWAAVNWFVYKGLVRYEFWEEAKKIKESSFELIEREGFREHFNPETGEGLGAFDFTWGGLLLDMETQNEGISGKQEEYKIETRADFEKS